MTGIELIAKERKEQIEKHGRTIGKDAAENGNHQLSFAAALFSCPNPEQFGGFSSMNCPEKWSLEIWLKMGRKPYEDRLVIAGALIAAEIDRLQYK